MSIPKVIHYCWFGGAPLPKDVKQCIKSWKKYCPQYEIKCWSERNFDVKQNAFINAAYDAKAWAFVSDYARLKILYDNGGIYLDTDVELLKPLDSLLTYGAYFGKQQNDHLVNTGIGFGAEKGNYVIKEMLKMYEKMSFKNDNRSEISCPNVNTKVLKDMKFNVQSSEVVVKDNIAIFPEYYFDPYPSGSGKNLMCSDTISIHHYSASWTNGKQRIKRKIARVVGENRILRIKELLGK